MRWIVKQVIRELKIKLTNITDHRRRQIVVQQGFHHTKDFWMTGWPKIHTSTMKRRRSYKFGYHLFSFISFVALCLLGNLSHLKASFVIPPLRYLAILTKLIFHDITSSFLQFPVRQLGLHNYAITFSEDNVVLSSGLWVLIFSLFLWKQNINLFIVVALKKKTYLLQFHLYFRKWQFVRIWGVYMLHIWIYIYLYMWDSL